MSSVRRKVIAIKVCRLALALLATALLCRAQQPVAPASAESPSNAGLYVKVQLAQPLRTSKLHAGEIVEGTLARDVYSTDRKVFSAGSPVRLNVDHLEKRKRTPNDHWPWLVKAFTPRHESCPVFNEATVIQGDNERTVKVSLIAISRTREVHAKAKKGNPERGAVEVNAPQARKPMAPTLVLEAANVDESNFSTGNAGTDNLSQSSSMVPDTLPAGTHCKIVLLGSVSASKGKPGDLVQARLLEPVMMNSKIVLPAGSSFQGKVLKATPPRWLSRAGSLYLAFNKITLPNGNAVPISASVAGAELDQSSHTRIDAEGKLHGERPGKAWMAINFGVTSGIAKEVDDGMQLVIEAIISTATDASTAGTARLVSSGVSAVFMATRHGRDVVLPRFTVMDISLDRPISLERKGPAEGSHSEAKPRGVIPSEARNLLVLGGD